jgi:hypothetical protein
MRKIIITLGTLGFIAVIAFIAFMGHQFYKDYKRPEKPTELSEIAYYKNHHREINEKFVVDNIGYTVTSFDYYPKKDTTFLYVDILIENKTNSTKKYIDSFFLLKEGSFKNYYPKLDPYPVFENEVQNLKIQYILPEKLLPYLKYNLYINSQTDTAQNRMIILYKNYRANG